MSALDKAEIERVGDAEQVVDRARAETKPLARDVLQRFMLLFDSLAGHYQPGSPSNPNVNANDALFRLWSERAVDCAKALAPYESATYRAVVLPAAPDPGGRTTRFRLRVFDSGRREVELERRDAIPRPPAREPVQIEARPELPAITVMGPESKQ